MHRHGGDIGMGVDLLLIEGDPGEARRFVALLGDGKEADWRIHVARDLAGGLEALASARFDVLLLNLFLPDSSGLNTFGRLQAAAPSMPIVVYLAPDGEALGLEAVRWGAQDFLPHGLADGSSLRRTLAGAMARNQREQALRCSENKFRTIIETLEDAYYEVDLAGNYTFVNEAVAKHMGRPREKLIGMNTREYTPPETHKAIYRVFSEVHRTGITGKVVDFPILRPDGTVITVEVSVSLLRDAEGNPVGFSGISRDVTAKKMAEKALRESEEKYRGILASIEDGYFEVDLQGRLTFFNGAMSKILGYAPDELMSLDNRTYMDRKTAAKVFKAYRRIYETGLSNRSLQYEVITKKGSVRFIESSVSLMKAENNRPVGFRGIGRDITKRKKAEIELARAKERAEEATRAKSEFLANMSHEIRTPMNGIIGMYNLLLSTDLTSEQADFVETGKRSADSLLAIINDILDFSKIEAGKLEIEVIDFDLRKTIEELVALPAMQAHAKKLEFAYEVDHEVPSLLRGDPGRLRQIIMNVTMNAIKFTPKGEVLFRAVLEKETDLKVTIRFSVKDTGIGISESNQKRLFTSFQQVDASTTRKYGGTGLGLAISKQLVELMGGRIGVHSKLNQGSTFWFTAVFEKQSNAVVKTFAVPETLRAKRILIVDDNKTNLDILAGYLTLWGCTCDRAVGAEMALSLMRAVAKAGAPYELLITDMIMPEMDGAELGRRIKADPMLKDVLMVMLTSQGIRGDAVEMKRIGFSAYLTKPVRRSQLFDCLVMVINRNRPCMIEKVRPQLITSYSLSEDKRRSTRILLAEDNSINQKLALHLLSRFGFQADAVFNGSEALRALTRTPYDIVLMDVQMPEMDGLEATRRIRDPNSAVLNHQVPIIAMTAHAMKGDRRKCLKAGMNDYVSKPIQPDALLESIERQIRTDKKGTEVLN